MISKVWNDHTYDYSERFKGDQISIKAGSFIEMDHEDAINFLGQMNTIKRTADGGPCPTSFKRLRIEAGKPDIKDKTLDENKCQLCKESFPNQLELSKHVMENHAHALAGGEDDKKTIQETIRRSTKG